MRAFFDRVLGRPRRRYRQERTAALRAGIPTASLVVGLPNERSPVRSPSTNGDAPPCGEVLDTTEDMFPRTLYTTALGVHNTECPICFNPLVASVTVVRSWPCGHAVCDKCAHAYINIFKTQPDRRCVVCRSSPKTVRKG